MKKKEQYSAKDCVVCTGGIVQRSDTMFKQLDGTTVEDYHVNTLVICAQHYPEFHKFMVSLVGQHSGKAKLIKYW